MIWKNPGADQAGRLLEKAGLRGKRVGAAEISAKHANFVVNRGGATARDILALVDLAIERVSATGVRLQSELCVLGD